jgi:DNA polymerase-3 subunit delta
MAALKAQEVESFLRKPDLDIRLLLVYGPDQGLVSERAAALASAHLKGSQDPFALIRLEGDSIAGDVSRIADEVYTVGMFGGERVVRLRVGSKPVVAAIEAVVKGPRPEACLIVEGGDLKASAPLRKLFETARSALAIPCYQDAATELTRLIDEELVRAGFSLSPEARTLLLSSLGGDRLASRQELRKIALYCHGRAAIAEDDILAISGDVSTIGVDAVVDAVGQGDIAGAALAYRRLVAEGTPPSVICGAVLRHFHQLQSARADVDRGRAISDVMRSLVPPLFYKRQGAFERQLANWSIEKAERAAVALDKAMLDNRRWGAAGDAAVERTLLSVAGLAKRRGG